MTEFRYSNNGLDVRCAEPGWPVLDGETLLLDHKASDEELRAAFPDYDVAKAARDVPPVIWTVRQFMARFTRAELLAIADAKRTNATLEIWWATAMAGDVHRDHPDTAAGLAYLQSLGLLTAARVAEIMG